MPLKLFLSCVGDLATVGGSMLVVTSFWPLSDSFSFCLRGLGISTFFFTVAVYLHCGRAEFLRDCDVSRTHKGDACCLDTLVGAYVHCHFIVYS